MFFKAGNAPLKKNSKIFCGLYTQVCLHVQNVFIKIQIIPNYQVIIQKKPSFYMHRGTYVRQLQPEISQFQMSSTEK